MHPFFFKRKDIQMGSDQRIGILINCLEMGGAQQMALQVFDRMEKKMGQVYLITMDTTREMPLHPNPDRARQLAKKKICLSRLDTTQPVLSKILAAPFQYAKLLGCIQKKRLNVLISFEDRANIFNMLVFAIPTQIISIRHPMKSVLAVKHPVKKLLISLFFSLLVRRVSVANFNSQASMNEFVSLFPISESKLSVIYNFCDHAGLDQRKTLLPADARTRALLDKKYIVACGRLKPVKGYAGLIRAFEKVAQSDPDIHLIVLGDGPLKQELQGLAEALGLKDRVLFPGFVSNIAPWLARAKVFVLSSQSEGFPNVLLEAMALKTAVVSVDCTAGPREILSPDTGFTRKTDQIEWAPFGVLTPPLIHIYPVSGSSLDPSEQYLAEAISALLEDPGMRIRYESAGYQRSLDFSVSVQKNKWLDLISSERANRSAPN
jgi:glycosyltransferase involved in cell wall biosynthesis